MTYINPRAKVLRYPDRIAAWQRGEKPAPVTLEWDLSSRCPWGCRDCHMAYTHTKGPWTRDKRILPMAFDPCGDLADTARTCSVLEEVAAAGVKTIVWTGGGEPSVHPDALDIWKKAHEVGLGQGIYTLGATLNGHQINLIRDCFEWVVISLDHVSHADYTADKRCGLMGFQNALNNTQRLAGGTCTVGASYLLHEKNWHQARLMVEQTRALGGTYTTLRPTIRTNPDNPAVPVGDRDWVSYALELLDELSAQDDVEVDPSRFIQWRNWTNHGYSTCYGIRLNATITPDLRVWVCPNRRGYAGSSIGDLKTHSWAEVWANHPGQWTDLRQCRAMCRLNPVNETLWELEQPKPHEAFI